MNIARTLFGVCASLISLNAFAGGEDYFVLHAKPMGACYLAKRSDRPLHSGDTCAVAITVAESLPFTDANDQFVLRWRKPGSRTWHNFTQLHPYSKFKPATVQADGVISGDTVIYSYVSGKRLIVRFKAAETLEIQAGVNRNPETDPHARYLEVTSSLNGEDNAEFTMHVK